MFDLVNQPAIRQSPSLVPSSGVRLLPAASRFVLRGGPPVTAAAGAAIGLNLQTVACRSSVNGERAALWQGPDEQLLLTSVSDGEPMGRSLREALGTLPHSLVDVSHRQIALEVHGAQAADVLNAGCPLDLHMSAFPVGMCTRTLLGKCDIVLWRRGVETFHIEVWRSFADYASRFLAEAGETL
jgi:sarcosine oxidase, subunit gamma